MSGACALSGVCTTLSPPRALIDIIPAVPQSPYPDSTTPITRDPYAVEAVRNRTSAAGRCPFSFGPRTTSIAPCRTIRWLSGGAT